VLRTLPQINDDMLYYASNAQAARDLLSGAHFDLLILDVVLPARGLTRASSEVGLRLLTEVVSGDKRIITPTHIIGITAHEELMEEAAREFSSRLLTLSLYDESSDEWKLGLVARAKHVALSLSSKPQAQPDYDCDLAIVCALQSPELNAVLSLPWNWLQDSLPHDDTIYYRGKVELNGEVFSIAAASAERMGMCAATVLSCKLITGFRPRYLAMTGIAAGVVGKCNYGDVLIANEAFDHGNGKFAVDENGDVVFLPSPHHINISNGLSNKLKLFRNDRSVADTIRNSWQGATVDHLLSMKFGPLASGAAVHADNRTIKDLLGRQRDLIGLDMESYGVMVAASDAPEPRPECLIMKSVVDFGGSDKDDRFHHYAAFTSAQALKAFSERFIFVR